MTHAIQVRLPHHLKGKLDVIASRMEIPVSTLIRSVLASFAQQPHAVRLTINGFTADEEERILQSARFTEKAIREGKAETFQSVDDALSALEKESTM